MATILVVDDDRAIRDVVCFALTRAGFAVQQAADGAVALRQFRSAPADLIVLDVLMPELDGTDLCRTLRRTSSVPILFLSSMDDEIDRVVGLEVGGDDYLTKPFSPRELVARVRAILRRSTKMDATGVAPEPMRHGLLTLDAEAVRASWAGQEVTLTATEFGLLRTLFERSGRVVSRDGLMDGAYSAEHVVSDRTIDSHIRRIRAKFAVVGGSPIETLPGMGYRIGRCDG